MKSSEKGIKRILKAFCYSFDGFISVFRSEAAFRQDVVFCLVMGVLAFFLPIQKTELVLLIFPLFLILMAELINTAIESVVDRIGEEYHLLSKKAKDIGSLLVLLSFVYWAISWGIILLPLIIH
jgi:diacylglycerol kinase (ATP)